MNSDLVYHPNTSRITYEIIEGEVIIVDFDTGVYYSINALGSVIFNWIAHGANLGDVHKVIGTHFRVPETALCFLLSMDSISQSTTCHETSYHLISLDRCPETP